MANPAITTESGERAPRCQGCRACRPSRPSSSRTKRRWSARTGRHRARGGRCRRGWPMLPRASAYRDGLAKRVVKVAVDEARLPDPGLACGTHRTGPHHERSVSIATRTPPRSLSRAHLWRSFSARLTCNPLSPLKRTPLGDARARRGLGVVQARTQQDKLQIDGLHPSGVTVCLASFLWPFLVRM